MERLESAESSSIAELSAYDLWLRANRLMDEWTSEADAQAIPLFERALEIDPKFARAHSGLAAIYNCRNLLYPGNPNDREDLELGYKHAKQAVALGTTAHPGIRRLVDAAARKAL